ncbi:Do family serine endopeptidase [Hyphomicrobium sp.]|uniref:Do family serine endopeptidase n=1 Tax=Hyphomicrobium sp. TaxID=82 RepID=UPI0025C141D7|nr:Do family serine endopeptidase [Hyphomicrobium sp.]MCC7251842.1 Do family serine endopeptidase [Hyphomicrobium sp.]
MSRKIKELAVLAGAGLLAVVAVFGLARQDAAAQLFDGLFPSETPPRREVPPSREVAQYSFSPIVRKAAPAVVNVYVQRRVQTFSSPFANDPFFRQFFGDAFGQPSERIQSSLGSGVIVSPDGIVVTNTHVIRGRGETEIRVALSDKREFDAKVLTQDDKTDIAILKIDNGEQRFPTLELEDSDTLEVGDMVLAIGNPFGVGQTVTSGIVSALARSEIGISDSQVFIQTDAAINPGNSGGALVDMSGKLVGINTMIFSQSGGSQGIGFAIPSNLVRLYVQGAAEGRKVERPWLGARLETVTRDMAEGLGLDRVAGAVVARVSDSGPAAGAGLKAGDVIVNVDGFEVADARAVQYRLTTRGVGRTVKVGIIRKGQPHTVELPLVAAPKPGRDDVRNLAGQHPLDGARVSNILPGVVDELGIDEIEGVVVLSVRRASTAARLGFQPGDVIAEIGGVPVTNVRDLEGLLATRQRMWLVAVRRGDKVFNLQVPG